MGLYTGKSFRQRVSQWHLLHTHVWWNRLRRRYDNVRVERKDVRVSYSAFPHPLVVFDYSDDGELVGVEVVGKSLKVRSS